MALDCSPANLYEEVHAAVKFRELHTKPSELRHEQYVGSTWQEGKMPTIRAHENHAFDTVINMLPVLTYANPRIRVGSRRPKVQRAIAEALTHGINRWIKDVDFSRLLTPIAQDTVFDFGVALLTMEPAPGYEEQTMPPLRPMLSRISPRRFFADPQCINKDEARFMGHESSRDKEDLLKAKDDDGKPLYNREVLLKIQPNDSDQSSQGRGWDSLPKGINRVPRKQIRVIEVYVKEERKIYTLAQWQVRGTDNVEFLRPPRDYFGPPWGPYYLIGLYAPTDQLYPVSPLAITDALVEELNTHIDQIMSQADTMRQVTMVNATSDQAVEAVKNAKNGDILAIPGFSKDQVETVTWSGPSPEGMAYAEALRQRLDRVSGMAEFQRGNVTGDATATENQLAASATDVRRKFNKRVFQAQVRQLLMGVLWYMVESKNVVFHVPVPKSYFQNQGEGGESGIGDEEQQPAQAPGLTSDSEALTDGVFMGGKQDNETMRYEDLELEIEPNSMELTDEPLYRQQLQQSFAILSGWAPAMMQFPFLNWPKMVDDLFEASNIKDGRKYINFEMLQQMIQAQFAAGAEQTIPGVDGEQVPDPNSLKIGGAPNPGTGPIVGQIGMQAGGRGQASQETNGPGANFDVRQLAGMLGGMQRTGV